jgi:dienelactone hydrolase
MDQNMIGAYRSLGEAVLGDKPARLSFRNNRFKDVDDWRAEARAKARELLASPDLEGAPKAEVLSETVLDGVLVQRLRWQLPYGPATDAVVLKPEGAKGRLPGVLGLHCHAGAKYFGWRKIADDGSPINPELAAIRKEEYEEHAWANRLAKRGYVVLCHDGFLFASRRVRIGEVLPVIRWNQAKDVSDGEPPEEIRAYNQWAGQHEHVMSKSLLCAGTTWPGVVVAEDQRALDVLCARDDVDPERIGCGGLSGGGLRTVLLGGMDERIKCAVCAGLMTTWRDGMLWKSHTHTWMLYVPLLPQYLDWPELLGLRVPLPTMVMNNNEDNLFTLSEMQRADDILREVYEKAGAADRYQCTFYPGPHKFDLRMQDEAFDWYDRWLKSQ